MRFVLLAAVIIGLMTGVSYAQTDIDVFTVRDVAVDSSSQAATTARDTATAQGRQAAFAAILRRLTMKADWPRLPVSEDASRHLAGFSIADERTSTTRYLAKITYRFKPASIRALLQGRGIPFAETRAKPIVVLPILSTSAGPLLWQPQNPWGAAWRARSLAQALAPMIVPQGDLDDQSATASLNLGSPDWNGVRALAENFGARSALVPLATARKTPTAVVLDVRLLSIGPEGQNEQKLSFQGADENAAYGAAIETIAQTVQEAWKKQIVPVSGAENAQSVYVRFSSLQEWVDVRRKLETAPAIKSVRIVGISVDEAFVDLRFVGTRDQLAVKLAQQDLSLQTLWNGSYEIAARTPATAPAHP